MQIGAYLKFHKGRSPAWKPRLRGSSHRSLGVLCYTRTHGAGVPMAGRPVAAQQQLRYVIWGVKKVLREWYERNTQVAQARGCSREQANHRGAQAAAPKAGRPSQRRMRVSFASVIGVGALLANNGISARQRRHACKSERSSCWRVRRLRPPPPRRPRRGEGAEQHNITI